MIKQPKPGTVVVREEEREIKFKCPERGWVTQKVKVKVYETGGKPHVQVCR